MLERLMMDQRKRATGALLALFATTLFLWLLRGPRPLWSNVRFLTVSMLLTPLAYFGVYGILYLNVRVNHISNGTLRKACGVVFIVGAGFLALSAMSAARQFMTHRPIPPANFLALGVALGAMKAWRLQVTTTVPGDHAR